MLGRKGFYWFWYKLYKIHSFEPAHGTFATLKSKVQADNVKLNNFGISNEISESIL